MKNKLFAILLMTFLFATTKLFATVDYLVVNHLTKQLYWAETDNPPGWIGWKTIPDGLWEREEHNYLEMGYNFTNNPFLIEEFLASIVGLLILGFWTRSIIRKIKTPYNMQ